MTPRACSIFIKQLTAVFTLLFLLSPPLNATGVDTRTIEINLGLVKTLRVPTAWKLEDDRSTSNRRLVKRRESWWDCVITLQIDRPIEISQEQSRTLHTAMSATDPRLLDIPKDIPGLWEEAGDGPEETKATTCSIKGKTVMIVEHKGQMNGPCDSTSGKQRRIPRLNYVRGAACTLVDSTTVQVIRFDADVMGDVKPCSTRLREVLNTIDWSH